MISTVGRKLRKKNNSQSLWELLERIIGSKMCAHSCFVVRSVCFRLLLCLSWVMKQNGRCCLSHATKHCFVYAMLWPTLSGIIAQTWMRVCVCSHVGGGVYMNIMPEQYLENATVFWKMPQHFGKCPIRKARIVKWCIPTTNCKSDRK